MRMSVQEDELTGRTFFVGMQAECAGEEIFLSALHNLYASGSLLAIIAESHRKRIHCRFVDKRKNDHGEKE